jgi:hypothetical protein
MALSFRMRLAVQNAGIVTGILFGNFEPWKPPPGAVRLRASDGREVIVVDAAGREMRAVASIDFGSSHGEEWTPPSVRFELVRAFYGWAAPHAWIPTSVAS